MVDRKVAVDPAGRARRLLGWFVVSSRGLRVVRDDHLAGTRPLDPNLLRGVVSLEPWFRAQLIETEELAYFALVAAAEALIRNDYRRRVAARGRDTVSRRFRELSKSLAEERPKRFASLDRDILEIWRDEVVAARSGVSALRSAIKYRNWIAHGKYFEPKLGAVVFDPEDLFDELGPLFTAIGLIGWV